MKKFVLNDFQHKKGLHCSSTAIMNVCFYYGHHLSEAMCFGIGEGLDFIYTANPNATPQISLIGRSPFFEPVFFKNIGYDWRIKRLGNLDHKTIKSNLIKGNPSILITDLYYLDYVNSKNYYSGHSIVITGYDDEKKQYFISDSLNSQIEKSSYESVENAISSIAPPLYINNQHFYLDYFQIQEVFEAGLIALKKNALKMLKPPKHNMGAQGMELALSQMNKWSSINDWSMFCILVYEMNEKRGSGGAAFRNLFKDFLAELSVYYPFLLEFHEKFSKICEIWGEFLAVVGEAGVRQNSSLLIKAEKLFKEIVWKEKDFYQTLVKEVDNYGINIEGYKKLSRR
ncbi:BtrH N-terminal domain-containing protein [Ornithinibacillus sp. FSL M8-0202]|uniref:BtrH N-terminal domain-containing protein n=1 Tax=Ornithinibacillus sp. FSL M8-0202 TaxID=2921616 RepID=UPI0030D07F82